MFSISQGRQIFSIKSDLNQDLLLQQVNFYRNLINFASFVTFHPKKRCEFF